MLSKALFPVDLPSLAIAVGATTPAGSKAGQLAWSSTLGCEMLWNGVCWLPIGNRILGQSAVAASVTGTTVETTLATIALPAGSLGANGQLKILLDLTCPNNANNKTFKVKLGATTLMNMVSTTVAGVIAEIQIANRNSASSQRWSSRRVSSTGTGSYSVGTSAEDTSAALNLTITAQLAAAADTVTLESFQVLMMPKA